MYNNTRYVVAYIWYIWFHDNERGKPNLMIQARETFCGHTRSVYVQMRGMHLVFDLIEGHDVNISRNRIGRYKRVWVARQACCEHWLGFVHDTTP